MRYLLNFNDLNLVLYKAIFLQAIIYATIYTIVSIKIKSCAYL